MKKSLLFSTLVAGLFIFVMPSSAATADHLVISQVQITGGAGHTTDDFVEIYNPSSSDIDLNGYRLVKRTKTGTTDTLIKSWTSSTIVKAHGYYLWANSSYTAIPAAADVTTTGTLADDNGVALRNGSNDTGTIIDSVAWGAAANAFVEGTVFVANPEANQSLERKPGSGSGNGEDTNDNGEDFFTQSAPHPRNANSPTEIPATPVSVPESSETPTSTPAVTPAGPVSNQDPGLLLELTEIFANPKGRDSGYEWVELYNPGASPVDVSGWAIDDDGPDPMPGSSAFLLAAGTKISAKSHLAVMIPKGQASLNNSGGDAVRLFDSNSALRLKVSYEGTVKEGYAYAKDQTGKWVWSDQPTPGALNIIAQIVSYPSTLIFSEVLPNPEGDDAEGEFMEIFNTGSDSIDLADWSVSDGRRKYQISEDDFLDTELAGQKYLVLYREVTGISLNNTGEEQLELYNPLGEKVDTLVLDASGKEAEAYAWDGQGFAWTEKPTPGAKNKFSSTSEKKTVEKKIITPQTKTVILKNIREQELGSVIKTSGTVSVEPDVLGEGVLYLAGSGIRVVLPKNFDGTLEPGQFLELTGVLSSFHNELQLKVQNPADITVTEDLRELNTHEIKTGDVAEATEGFLVTVSGNLTENAGDNFVLDDGSGPAKVHLMESAGINKPKMKKGELLTVTGLVSQYDENFRILPRYQSDIVTGQGQVAGISAGGPSLPRTGTDFWLIVAVFSGFCYNLLLLTRKES